MFMCGDVWRCVEHVLRCVEMVLRLCWDCVEMFWACDTRTVTEMSLTDVLSHDAEMCWACLWRCCCRCSCIPCVPYHCVEYVLHAFMLRCVEMWWSTPVEMCHAAWLFSNHVIRTDHVKSCVKMCWDVLRCSEDVLPMCAKMCSRMCLTDVEPVLAIVQITPTVLWVTVLPIRCWSDVWRCQFAGRVVRVGVKMWMRCVEACPLKRMLLGCVGVCVKYVLRCVRRCAEMCLRCVEMLLRCVEELCWDVWRCCWAMCTWDVWRPCVWRQCWQRNPWSEILLSEMCWDVSDSCVIDVLRCVKMCAAIRVGMCWDPLEPVLKMCWDVWRCVEMCRRDVLRCVKHVLRCVKMHGVCWDVLMMCWDVWRCSWDVLTMCESMCWDVLWDVSADVLQIVLRCVEMCWDVLMCWDSVEKVLRCVEIAVVHLMCWDVSAATVLRWRFRMCEDVLRQCVEITPADTVQMCPGDAVSQDRAWRCRWDAKRDVAEMCWDVREDVLRCVEMCEDVLKMCEDVWRCVEDVLKMCWRCVKMCEDVLRCVEMCRRCVEDVWRCVEDVWRMCWRCVEDVLRCVKMCWRCAEDVLRCVEMCEDVWRCVKMFEDLWSVDDVWRCVKMCRDPL